MLISNDNKNPAKVELYDQNGNRIGSVTNPVNVSNNTGTLASPTTITFVDSLGVEKRLKWNAEAPQVSSQDYLQSIAEGDIVGHTPFEKFGHTTNGNTSETDIWEGGTTYIFPTSAMQMEVVSSSTNDTPTGTGAKTVRIFYLDNNYIERTEDVVLNGVTAVSTVATNILRVNTLKIVDFGSASTTYKAIGNIDIRHISDTPIYSRIATGYTRSRNSIFTVPVGKTLYVTSMGIGISKGGSTGIAGVFTLRGTYDSDLGALTPGLHFKPQGEINHLDGAFYRMFEMPVKYIEKTDIKVSVICAQASTVCTCALRGWIE